MNIPTKASSNWLSGFREKHYKLRKPFGQLCVSCSANKEATEPNVPLN